MPLKMPVKLHRSVKSACYFRNLLRLRRFCRRRSDLFAIESNHFATDEGGDSLQPRARHSSHTRGSYSRPRASNTQIVRAILLESATTAMFVPRRAWTSSIIARADHYASLPAGRLIGLRAQEASAGSRFCRADLRRCGLYGRLWGSSVLRDAHLFRIYEGTTQIQQIVTARELRRSFAD
jgi:hypothetical protein